MPSDESGLWRRILELPSVKEKIHEQGFFLSSDSFRQITSSIGKQMRMQAPGYLSKDFWSGQPPILTRQGCYVLRTGIGRFAILDEKVFPRPYLSLQTSSAIELKPEIPSSFKLVKKAFDENAQENAALEQMRFLGIFERIITNLFGTSEYIVGPRSSRSSTFDVYIEKNDGQRLKLCTYKGQEELDYSLWTESNALLFEAKQTNQLTGFLDLGWHKLVYPANRFRGYDNSLFPVYFLRRQNKVQIFVFPKIQFYESGIVLNEKPAMTPEKTYEIRL